MITDEELQQWAEKRADDAGMLARYIVAMRAQVRAQMAATALHYRAVNVGQALKQLGDEDALIRELVAALEGARYGLNSGSGNHARLLDAIAKAKAQGYGP